MTKEELIKQCRYYNGENKNPFIGGEYDNADLAKYWDWERVYVLHNGNFIGEADYYRRINGRKYMGIPYNLLMVMFTSWGKYTTDIEKHIEDFYNEVEAYLSLAGDHVSRYKIPS